ncbi:DUF4846 domain-containing protein [Aquimarina brevivitae]|uniref:Uncharacterized protein DUF4846 n=1 Tax=Aquimarina brevivitae TaxID=323412 RepID=A0A4Q7NX69_9FLAO|nr:DUF4846 domain-containing protein [Aquimarina brevivitae]RZS91966.1 uncharacterized protein DUF4846 [Aquimarina brevivitae]
MKSRIVVLGLLIVLGCKRKGSDTNYAQVGTREQVLIETPSLLNPAGNTIMTRVLPPSGYHRVQPSDSSFQQYLQHYPLKNFGAKIYTYKNELFAAQDWHVGVLEIDVPPNGLQQCADALIRIRAEYLWNEGRKDEIGFEFTSGHYCKWLDYASGFRPKISGNKVSFHKTKPVDHSKRNFYRYLNLVYTYAGTLSLYNELEKIELVDLKIGDMLVDPGTPGHINMIVDQAKDSTGNYLYVMAQGYTPAQSVCLLKNTSNKEMSPWYSFSEQQSVITPSYYFDKPVFIRFK